MALDNETLKRLAGPGKIPTTHALVRYVYECMRRERERLARRLRDLKADPAIADALLDESDDERIFEFTPPEDKK